MIKKLILFLFLSLVNSSIFASSSIHSPRRIEATFSFEVVVDQQNLDWKKDLKYWCFLPREWINQKNIKILEINPSPNKKKTDKTENFTVCYWDLAKQKKSNSYTIAIKIEADISRVDNFIDPAIVPDVYDGHKNMVKKYTSNDSLVFITPEIIEIANEINRNVTDPFLKARNIFRWIMKHVEHQFPVIERGTRYLLANPLDQQHSLYGGDSAEYTWLFIALCRAANVPARPVVGFLAKSGWESPHTWAEFYLAELGWIPADIYLADSKELVAEFSGQHDQYFYLGHLDNYHLTFYKGNNFQLKPECSYSAAPFIQNNVVWYSPVGIWNFNKLSNVNAHLHVNYTALLIEKYVSPEYGVQINLFQPWLQTSTEELGPYLFKEKFTDESKTVTLSFVGRKLPSAQKDITAEQAARFEINALKQIDKGYKVHSTQDVKTNGNVGFGYIATTTKKGKMMKEFRLFVVKSGNLYWLIVSAENDVFDKNEKLFEKIMQSVIVDPPKRRMF